MTQWLLPLFSCCIIAACSTGGSGSSAVPSLSRSAKTEDLPVAWQSPNIFEKYSKTGNAKMAESWTRKLDASGISFDDKKTCTLITPRHVMMAKHYQRPVFSTIVFHDRQGKRETRKLISIRSGIGDYVVGLLDEPMPARFKAYPLLKAEPDLPTRLPGQYTLITDQNRRVFLHQIVSIGSGHIRFRHNPDNANGYRKNLVSGDSGNPSFVIVRGQPVLIETHTTGGPGAGPFYGDPSVQAEISQLVQAMDSSYAVRTVAW